MGDTQLPFHSSFMGAAEGRGILEQRTLWGGRGTAFKYLKGRSVCARGASFLLESPEGEKVAGFEWLKGYLGK